MNLFWRYLDWWTLDWWPVKNAFLLYVSRRIRRLIYHTSEIKFSSLFCLVEKLVEAVSETDIYSFMVRCEVFLYCKITVTLADLEEAKSNKIKYYEYKFRMDNFLVNRCQFLPWWFCYFYGKTIYRLFPLYYTLYDDILPVMH